MPKYQDLIAGEDSLLAVTGRAWVVGNDIRARDLLGDAHFADPPHIACRYVLAAIAPGFSANAQAGDFLVAGLNFAAGPSLAMETAPRSTPHALRALGLAAVIARSFGEVFLRSAIQCGLPALMVEETAAVKHGDRLRLDVEAHIVANLSSGDRYVIRNIDDEALQMLRAGGIAPPARARQR